MAKSPQPDLIFLDEREVRELIAGLHELYPDADCELRHSNALELLVATILSAQCTDARVNRVTERYSRNIGPPLTMPPRT